MKRKVHWSEDVRDNPASITADDKFEQVRQAVFDKRLAKVAKILTSLTDEQALELIHKKNGQIIRIVIKLACIEKARELYEAKAGKFDNIYKIFLRLDKNYTHEMLLKASGQIMEVDPDEPLPRLLEISDAIEKAQAALRISNNPSSIIKGPEISFATKVSDDRVARRASADSSKQGDESKGMER